MAKTRTASRRRRPPASNALGRAFKRRLQGDDLLLGGTVTEYLRPSLVKMYAHAGYDFIYVEKEHTLMDGPELTDFVLSCRDNQMPVISKVGELNRSEVARLLEAGVIVMQLPRTEGREQLDELHDYMTFPPGGSRAGAPGYGNADYIIPANQRAWMRGANEATLINVHIETALGLENAEESVSCPHIGMVYVGPTDFSIELGHPGDYDHPDVRKGMDHILKLCLKHGVPFGTTPTNRKAAARWVARGCRFFEMHTELDLVYEGACRVVDEFGSLK